MSRSKKLLIAGLVLLLGVGLAWPFRKSSGEHDRESVAKRQPIDVQPVERVENRAIRPAGPMPLQLGSPASHVVAKMTKMSDDGVFRQRRLPAASFDLANHPALATPLAPRLASPVTPPMPPQVQIAQSKHLADQVQNSQVQTTQVQKYQSDPRLVYSTIDRDHQSASDEQQDAEVRHIVQNSDTLEKLAKRYLGDESRALEIFDLNRDVLDNPHLLPIDAELRIPTHTFVD